MKTPILLIIFNRPDTTKLVFEAIKYARPEKLYISADGPRPNNDSEEARCVLARKIIEKVDWPCAVHTNFSKSNLGCKLAVSRAISWFFSNEDEGIILEDDCVPNQSFFTFCSKMLEKYRDNEKIMHISGTTFLNQNETSNQRYSFHFSKYAHVWGWATWKRAWNVYDINMAQIDNLVGSNDNKMSKRDIIYWTRLFNHIKDKNIDTWDAQWQYSIIKNSGLVICPNINMITNIGFNEQATHTTKQNFKGINMSEMSQDINFPDDITIDNKADDKLMKKIYLSSFIKKILIKIKSIIS